MTAVSHGSRQATVYEPTTTGLPPLQAYLRGIWERRPFMWHVARTDLKAENFDSALGQLWIILDPLLMACVYYFLRTVVRPIESADRAVIIDHLIWGVFFFRFVSGSLRKGAQSILGNKQLIMNTAFPRAIFPIVSVLEALLDLLPGLAVFFVLHAALGMPFGLSLITLPLIIFLLSIFALGCALLYAPLTVYYRDTTALLPYITQIWLYATPVLYRVSEIPPSALIYLRFNPLYPFYAALEQVFNGIMPYPGYLVAAAAWSLVTFVFGAWFFLVREREFATRF